LELVDTSFPLADPDRTEPESRTKSTSIGVPRIRRGIQERRIEGSLPNCRYPAFLEERNPRRERKVRRPKYQELREGSKKEELELAERHLSSHQPPENRTSYKNGKYVDRRTKNEKRNWTRRQDLELVEITTFDHWDRSELWSRTESNPIEVPSSKKESIEDKNWNWSSWSCPPANPPRNETQDEKGKYLPMCRDRD